MIPDKSLHYAFADRTLKKSPAYCEARYLRTLESMAEMKSDRKEYALLWAFAMLDNQAGFALDVASEYESLFGKDDIGAPIKAESLATMQRKKLIIPAIKLKRRLKTSS